MRFLKKHVLSVMAAWVVIIPVVLSWGITSVVRSNFNVTNRSVQVGLRQDLLDACERLNVLRATNNDSHYGDYIVFRFVEKRFLIPKEFTSRLKIAINTKSWIPLTDCVAVSTHRASPYKPHAPILFSRSPAPKWATNLANASKPDPIGSVP